MPQDRIDQGRGPEDGETSRDGSNDSSGKRKQSDREPESPGHIELNSSLASYAKKERISYYGQELETISPSSYPKHVIVPTSERQVEADEKLAAYSPPEKSHGTPVLTPESMGRGLPDHPDVPLYPRHRPYHAHVEMDHSHQSRTCGSTGSGDNFLRPRRWACDYCNVATFLSFEEACAHEEACARQHQEPRYYDSRPAAPRGPVATPYADSRGLPPPQQGSGLGVLYHASQEVVTPPTPHRQPNHWGSRGPPLPVLPHDQGYYRQGYYDIRDDPARHQRHDQQQQYQQQYSPQYQHQQQHQQQYNPQYQQQYSPHQHHGQQQQQQQHQQQQHPPQFQQAHHQQGYYQKRMLLAMPSDTDSLSDRQCYVRSEMVEIFAATDKDVAARHSKGAQKLDLGQVGIRCVYCSHLRARDRAERAVCYPSSISRIYQTVADMQRFHFEQCREVPDHVRQVYKKLKTTRPRGVGSPQTYWIQSAKTMGLQDTGGGIRFDTDVAKQQRRQQQQESDMSISTL
jgi:hypothetical protein